MEVQSTFVEVCLILLASCGTSVLLAGFLQQTISGAMVLDSVCNLQVMAVLLKCLLRKMQLPVPYRVLLDLDQIML